MNADDPGLNLGLYQGLQALSELSFPKVCATCGSRYENAEDFIHRTERLHHSTGLKEDNDDNNQVIVELFRNCTCGSTLMDEFNNRRDLSKQGIERRKKFEELLDRLSEAGFSKDTARGELLNIMNGKGSQKLNVKASAVNLKNG